MKPFLEMLRGQFPRRIPHNHQGSLEAGVKIFDKTPVVLGLVVHKICDDGFGICRKFLINLDKQNICGENEHNFKILF